MRWALLAVTMAGCGVIEPIVFRCPANSHRINPSDDGCYCDTGYGRNDAGSGCEIVVASVAIDAGAADAGPAACGVCFDDGGSSACFSEDDAGHAMSTVPYCKK